MNTGTRLLMMELSILTVFGCSKLENDLPTTLQSLNKESCETCHPLRQEDSIHFNHVYDTLLAKKLTCSKCHTGYDEVQGWVDERYHRNGRVDTGYTRCELCHRYLNCDSCHMSPPTSLPKWAKVHKHVTVQNIKCKNCHKGYDLENRIFPADLHDNGNTDVVFDTPERPDFPTFPKYINDSCYGVYCHGAVTNGGPPAVAISDTKPQGAAQCYFCHNIDTLYKYTYDHSKSTEHIEFFRDCNICHPGFSYNMLATVDSVHRDGKLDTISQAECDACHNPVLPP